MRDGRLRRALKRAALAHFVANRALGRALKPGRAPYRLGGECRRCARCCEAPAIQATAAVWHLPTLRRLFLWWQRAVNGFELVRTEHPARVFVFRCTHFDWTTRSCDSYESRPGMCRDYPRALLEQPAPELLPGCGYRPVARNARALRLALERRGVGAEVLARVTKQLHLEE